MDQRKTAISIMVLMLLAVLCLASSAWPSLPWWTRSGTIANAKMLPDGSHVFLDAECIAKIKAKESDPYFLIAEPFEQQSRLVVLALPSPDLRLGQIVDIEGTITTLEDGLTRAIIGATVWGYTDAEGNLLYHGPLIKGLLERTPWQWMVNLTVETEVEHPETGAPEEASEQPNTNPAPGPSFYPEIADIMAPSADQIVRTQSYYDGIPDLQGLPDESLVELQCKRITAVGTEAINGITYSYVDISEDPPLTDTIRAYYTGTASTTDRINRISGQIQHVGTIPVICVDTGPDYDPQILEGSCQLAGQGSIAWAKTFPDGTQLPAGLAAKVVSADFMSGLGYFYMEEPSRAAGIRVSPTGEYWPTRGDQITITSGQITTVDNQRVLSVSPNSIQFLDDGTIAPLGMNNKMVTGGPFNVFTPGAMGAFGLNNVGLLVKTWGRVTGVQSSYLYFNDGSDNLGVKVDLDVGGAYIPHSLQTGDFAAVSGIASLEDVNGQLLRVLKPEGYYDIQVIQVIPHFTGIAANPVAAAAGTVVTITFSVDTDLSANPTVTVNSNSATYDSSSGYDYTYEYTVSESDEIGWATIAVTGTDTSGVSGSASSSTALLIAAVGFDDNGNRTSALDSRGVTQYEYDVLGRLTKATEPDGKWIAYEYDLNNNRTEMTVRLSDSPLVEHVTQYEYNDRNLLWHVTDQLSGVTTYTYHDNGLVDTITYPNGTKTVHTYSNRNWLTQISNRKSDDTIIAQFDYTYDTTNWGKNGTKTKVVENILKPDGNRINAQVDYEYDDLYRLTREHRTAYGGGDPGVAYDYYYSYDYAGNRMSWQVVGGTTTNYTYDAANKMTAPGTFTYDDAGNMLTHTINSVTTTYSWDYLNRMSRWAKTGETTQDYVYNADGMRVRKTPSGGTAMNFLLDRTEVAEEITGNNVKSYIGPGLISEISSTTRAIYHADGLGSTRAMSNCDTPVVITEAGAYDAYGNEAITFGNSPSFGFAGRHRNYTELDDLQYLNGRFYNPVIGRFISMDRGNLTNWWEVTK